MSSSSIPLLLAAVLALGGCGEGDPDSPGAARERPFLVEVPDAAGLDFVHALGNRGSYFMPEILGPGCALFDHDGDGDLDVYLTNAGRQKSGAPNRLFRQDPGLRFVDATESSGLGDPGYGMGVALGDVDGDGDLDVFVTNYGPNALYRNEGNGRFVNITAAAGVAGDDSWSCSAAFLDSDADGDLDLFVTNYVALDEARDCPDAAGRPEYCGPRMFPGAPDFFYVNNGDGTFSDATMHSGIGAASRRGLGVTCADLTGDGRPDIFVANDNDPNHLWINQGDGTFREEGLTRGVAVNFEGREEASMGVVCADLNGDLELDLFLTHLRGESNTLYLSRGGGQFSDATGLSGLMSASIWLTGFGAVAFDLEHDGDLDLATVNGRVARGAVAHGADCGPFWNPYAQPGQLYLSHGQGTFKNVSDRAGSFGERPRVGRGLATGDVDGDGDLDLLMTETGGRARLFLNEAAKTGHWLMVEATESGRHALGARIVVAAGSTRLMRRLDTSFSYLSASPPIAHFGLGGASGYDSIRVTWPDGVTETFGGGVADRIVRLVRGQGN